MSATATATENEAIASVVQLYIDGSSSGDKSKLEQAFHEQAWMYGSMGGERLDMPIAQMFELVAEKPLDADGSYSAKIVSIDQTGDVATARLEEKGCWGNVSFLDLFALARIDGSWKIVNKVFAHTGGEMPAS